MGIFAFCIRKGDNTEKKEREREGVGERRGEREPLSCLDHQQDVYRGINH